LKEFNKDLTSIIRAYVKSVKDVRSWREQAAGMAVSDPSRMNYQVAADAEADTIEHKREQVRAHYARWCPYMQRFCEAWSMSGKEVDDCSTDDYLACCRETMETIHEALQGGILSENYIAHLNASMEFFEGTIRQMQFCQDRARRTKEEREREEERLLSGRGCNNRLMTTSGTSMTDA
jgi:hypothetical protein